MSALTVTSVPTETTYGGRVRQYDHDAFVKAFASGAQDLAWDTFRQCRGALIAQLSGKKIEMDSDIRRGLAAALAILERD